MPLRTEYVIESEGNYHKTYEQVRASSDEDGAGERYIRVEQGSDTLIIGEKQMEDFIKALTLLKDSK